MEKWKKRTVELATSLAFGSDGTPSVVPYYPQKTWVSGAEERYFRRSTPERHEISSKRIFNMLSELESERRANLHNLIILKDGEVISECSRDGYGVNLAHLSHSMSKTVTGMLIGILVGDGLLTTERRVADIFPEIAYRDKKFADITVEHLLTMTSGVDFAEAGSITESRWTEAFFASVVRFAPGTRFAYNSMNSYILARILERVSGEPFGKFAERRFFAPMGIRNYFWEKGPEGTEKGGWGLYMSAESWAKVGQMFLSGGSFRGELILPSEWVHRSTKAEVVTTYINGDFNYGYQLWSAHETGEYLFNGMLGQNVWICPRNNIVAVITSGNNELFQDSPALSIIRKYLGTEIDDELHRRDVKVLRERQTEFLDSRRFVRPRERKQGIFYMLGLRPREQFDTAWNELIGEYRFGKNNVGLLPLVVRAMQNNLDSSLESLTISRSGDELCLEICESGARHTLRVGFYEHCGSVLDFHGEKYIVKCMGEALVGLDGEREYRIEVIFPELPNTRMIRIRRPDNKRITIELSEIPNDKVVEGILHRISEISSPLSFLIDLLERRFGEGVVSGIVRKTFNPTLIGADVSRKGYTKIVEEQTRLAAEESRVVRLIRALVSRFFKDDTSGEAELDALFDDAKNTAKPQSKKPRIITDIVNRMHSKK